MREETLRDRHGLHRRHNSDRRRSCETLLPNNVTFGLLSGL